MNMKRGFTLIELLVVIAIITILAAIAVPAVSSFLSRSQARSTFAEVRQIDTAVSAMLSDIGRRDFNALFTSPLRPNVDLSNPQQVKAAADAYTDLFYRLLRQGRNAEGLPGNLRTDLVQKMGTGYLDLDTDPFGQRYRFFIGPISNANVMPFRAYRQDYAQPERDGLRVPLVYDSAAKARLESDTVPGQPRADNGHGIPANRDLPVFVWSVGANALDDQGFYLPGNNVSNPETAGGGDDINNWDGTASGQGWMVWY